MGAVPGWALARHTWLPPDVKASVDFTANGPWWARHPHFNAIARMSEDKAQLRERLRRVRSEHVAALPPATKSLLFLRPPKPLVATIAPSAIIGVYAESS